MSAPSKHPSRHVPLATQVPVYFVDGIAIEDGPANAAAGKRGWPDADGERSGVLG